MLTMQNKWRVGSLFGIPLFIDPSWLLILILITSVNASDIASRGLANGSIAWAWGAGLGLALLLFGSVLLHELGHSLVAKVQGIEVKSITLFLFGGIASIDRESKTPEAAFQVAIAGPLVSFALFGLFWGLYSYVPEESLWGFISLDIARINLILGLFNLIPGLPLDGGQVLKAAVWKWTGDRFKGIRYAATSGRLLGTTAIALGLFVFFLAAQIGGLWLALIGWFVLRNANAYERLSTLQSMLLSMTAEKVMTRDFRVIDAHLSLREFADQYLLLNPNQRQVMFASSEGRYRGLIRPTAIQGIERSQWEQLELIDIAEPLASIPAVEEQSTIAQVICLLEDLEDTFITVLSPAGAVAGVIDRGDIVRAIAKEYNVNIPNPELQRIRSERSYPTGFPLVEIAKQLQKETNN